MSDDFVEIRALIERAVPLDPPRAAGPGTHPDHAIAERLEDLHQRLVDDDWPPVWQRDDTGLGRVMDDFSSMIESYYAHEIINGRQAIARDPNAPAVDAAVSLLVAEAKSSGNRDFLRYAELLAEYWSLIRRSYVAYEGGAPVTDDGDAHDSGAH